MRPINRWRSWVAAGRQCLALLVTGVGGAGAATVQDVATPAQIVTVNADGSLAPPLLEIYSGETVEWRLPNRTSAIIPVSVNADELPDSTRP